MVWTRSDLDSGKKIRVLKWGGVLESQNPKCQDLPKFQFWKGVGVLGKVRFGLRRKS